MSERLHKYSMTAAKQISVLNKVDIVQLYVPEEGKSKQKCIQ